MEMDTRNAVQGAPSASNTPNVISMGPLMNDPPAPPVPPASMFGTFQIATPATTPQGHQAQTRSSSVPPGAQDASHRPEIITVRSRDGSKLLPAPFQHSRIVDRHFKIRRSRRTSSPPIPLTQHICTQSQCAVSATFNTPELLELILQKLSSSEVLRLRQTSPAWLTIVETSPQLRLNHFIRAERTRPAEEFILLSLKWPGLDIKMGDEIDRGQWIEVTMTKAAADHIAGNARRRPYRSRSIFEGLRGGLGQKGSKAQGIWPNIKPDEPHADDGKMVPYGELYLTQPPIDAMQAFTAGAKHEDQTEEEYTDQTAKAAPYAKVSCDSGITLGFLASSALELPGEEIVFRGIVSFYTPDSSNRKRLSSRHLTILAPI